MNAQTSVELCAPHTLASIELAGDLFSFTLSDDDIPEFCIEALVLFSYPEEPETSQ